MAITASVEVYANDTKPYLEITLDDGATPATAIDLTDVLFVLFKMATGFDATDNQVVGECEVVGDPIDGTVRYQFEDGDLDTSGGYIGEISLVYTDYRVQTFPHFKVKVKPDLPNNAYGY